MAALISSADRPTHCVGGKSPQCAWSVARACDARRQPDLRERLHDRVVQPRRSGTPAKNEWNLAEVTRSQSGTCGEWVCRGQQRTLDRVVGDLNTRDLRIVDRT